MSRASKSREETPPMNGGASSIVRFARSRALLVTCCSLSFPNLRRAARVWWVGPHLLPSRSHQTLDFPGCEELASSN
jgi:hypothetical protein